MKHFFVINPHSFARKGYKHIIDDINQSFAESGEADYETYVSRYPRDAVAVVHDYINSVSAEETVRVYAVGGDGTFQARVNSVDLDKCVIQYLPFGSGNNAYITFYNRPFDLERDILLAGTFKADLGQANGEYFITMFGLALDAKVGRNLSKFRRFPISGKAKYYASIFYTLLFDTKPVNVRMTVDGVAEDKVSSFISITNGPTTGGQTPISPHSSAFDGKLNAIVAEKASLFESVRLFSKIKTGEHLNDPGVSLYLFEELVFESNDELMYEIEGEIRYADRIEVKARKDAITLKGKAI